MNATPCFAKWTPKGKPEYSVSTQEWADGTKTYNVLITIDGVNHGVIYRHSGRDIRYALVRYYWGEENAKGLYHTLTLHSSSSAAARERDSHRCSRFSSTVTIPLFKIWKEGA